MQIKDMFAKKIDRDLQGVIIVGQGEETNVAQELEEYVVTNELQKHFAEFFSAYKKSINDKTSKMGVWISGFFGSGKSHFLKILSYLLDNKQVGDKKALDYFIDDKKIVDSIVLSDMRLAANTPADVVLFNIDSKSDSTSKQNKDAIVNVFLKVFNEMQGFCGSMPYLADLEKQLSDKGLYEKFKSTFEELYGDSWESSRQDFDFISDTVAEALVEMGFMSKIAAENWQKKAADEYKISIEDFAERVKKYIDKKGKNHHVVFLVDEIGQYIGDNSNLMLNLQTVVEELGTKCEGKAWVIVTSQQDIDSIMPVKGNDFSKIQGRFETKLSLSSANVDAVIKKRILEKTDVARTSLQVDYEQKANKIKNLIFFNDQVEKKLYESEDDFADVYPFVPYQFNLLGEALNSIRTHGASGKHLSEGERSMLALFKESAVAIKEKEIGTLVPFYRFYNALENFLDHSHRGVILKAYENSYINPSKKEDVFAVNILKTLFMIKYVPEIEANIENITSLMVENIADERMPLKDKVQEALNVLTQQMLVQKNGTQYIFLTDEEQEINNEIEKENVETSSVIEKISEMIFEEILTDKKYVKPEFNKRYSFSFNQAVDDRPYKQTRTHDIGLRILTPWYEGSTDANTMRMISNQAKEVFVILPNDAEFLNEMRSALKIERFLRRNTSTRLTKYEAIKQSKTAEAKQRREAARLYLTEALKKAEIYVFGDRVHVNSKDAAGRVNEAMERLVNHVYHKLSYIDTPKNEADIRRLFKQSNELSINMDGITESNAHALREVQDFISLNSRRFEKTSLKVIKDRFMKAPYGFTDDDVNWLVARLFQRGEISLFSNGASINLTNKQPDEIVGLIVKKNSADKLLLEQRIRVSEKDKKAVQKIAKEVFGANLDADNEDKMLQDFQTNAKDMLAKINGYLLEYRQYAFPGKDVLETGKELLESTLGYQDPQKFFTAVSRKKDDFKDFEDDYQAVNSFFAGTRQKPIFIQSLELLKIYDSSKTFIENSELENTAIAIRDIVTTKNPYQRIKFLSPLNDKFISLNLEILNAQKAPVIDFIEETRQGIIEKLDTKEYADQKRDQYVRSFNEILEKAQNSPSISDVLGAKNEAEYLRTRYLNDMDKEDNRIARIKEAEAKKLIEQQSSGEELTPADERPRIRKTKYVNLKQVAGTSSWRLENADDVDRYISALKNALLKQMDEDTIINVEL